jgi:deazaflavin-dependent oxidoreductase (nitroreductase family)
MADNEDDNLFGAEHVRVFRETKGGRGSRWRNGTKILLLTTEGRSSHEPRTTPLIHEPDGDRWVVVASKGGAPDDPGWFKNMQANPDVEIDLGPEQVPVRMSVAEGEERGRLWTKMAAAWPDYDAYQEKTDREIPVVVLSRR